MKNKRFFLSGLGILILSGMVLTSCKVPVKTSTLPSSTKNESTDFLTDYGEKKLSSLAGKLRHSNSEMTHILILGDSHVAADFLSGQLRQLFQNEYGSGGVGFISPVAVPGNRYSNVSFSKARGWQLLNSRRQKNAAFTLGGNIVSPLPASVEYHVITMDNAPRIRAQMLYRSMGGATLTLQGKSLLLADTQGHWELSEPADVPASFAVSFAGGNVAQLGGLWLRSSQSKGVIVSALGINGAQISMLDKWQNNWADTLRMLSPDMVILAYGTNEAFDTTLSLTVYREMLTRQIRNIRQAQPEAAILLIGPGSSIMNKAAVGCQQRQPTLLNPVIRVQKQVAEAEHTLFWDWFAWMGGNCAIERLASQSKARPDLIHLTAEGYKESATALWEALDRTLNNTASNTH